MPSRLHWRSASTADKLIQLDQDQFAIEFLRRNADYREDYRVTQDRIRDGSLPQDTALEALARRWGLIFPACSGPARLGFARALAPGAYTCCRHRCRGA